MPDTTSLCACCGSPHDQLAALECHPETAICRDCAHWLAGQFGAGPPGAATPILPVLDMTAAIAFWKATGFGVEPYDDGYAFVLRNGELLHLVADPTLDPLKNSSACYIHAPNVDELHTQWSGAGLSVSELEDRPWGMYEFNVKDPSGNLIRVGRNT